MSQQYSTITIWQGQSNITVPRPARVKHHSSQKTTNTQTRIALIFIKVPHVSCPCCEVAIPIAAEDFDNTKLPTFRCIADMGTRFDGVVLPALNAPHGVHDGNSNRPPVSSKKASSTPAGKQTYKKPPTEVDDQDRRKLQWIAARALMKLLNCARMARFELLRPVSHLARHVSKWRFECDRWLHRRTCYVNSTLHYQTHWRTFNHIYMQTQISPGSPRRRSQRMVCITCCEVQTLASHLRESASDNPVLTALPQKLKSLWLLCYENGRNSILDDMGAFLAWRRDAHC